MTDETRVRLMTAHARRTAASRLADKQTQAFEEALAQARAQGASEDEIEALLNAGR